MTFPALLYCVTCIVFMAFSTVPAKASPFNKPYVLTHKSVTVDGDLALPCPLTRLALDNKTVVEVWLEHRIVCLDYGEVRSHFILHPFETGLFPRGTKGWDWLRPGGGGLFFSKKHEVKIDAGRLRPKNKRDRPVGQPTSCYQAEGVELWIFESGWQAICDSGWVLWHREGSLDTFFSPDGDSWSVTASGKRITSIRANEHEVASIVWTHDLTAKSVLIENSHYYFAYRGGQLAGVSLEEMPIYSFQYASNMLLREIVQQNTGSVSFAWNEVPHYLRGDTPYALPFHLAAAGSLKYSYKNDDGVISIRSSSPGMKDGGIKVVTRYGRIISLKEE